jgi:solute carrier family 25 carnitine/acylcarnitine transporter 20/29
MTHDEKRTVWWKEGLAALITGVTYGISNVLVGHPLDTIKTKMQVLHEYKSHSMFSSISNLFRKEGIRGFYKGVIPPLLGGSIFRAVQFGVFEAFYTKWADDKTMRYKIPFTKGLELRILFAGIASGTARSIIECPFEYSKILGQTNQKWEFHNLYHGFSSLWIRTTGLMTSYFCFVDFFRRNTNAYKHDYGLFFMNGLCATMGFAIVWPFEIAKNIIQSTHSKESSYQTIRQQIHEHGFRKGLYKGSLPGLSSVFIRNGASMIVMIHAQKMLTKMGFRG